MCVGKQTVLCFGAVAAVPVAVIVLVLLETPTVTPYAWEKVSPQAVKESDLRSATKEDVSSITSEKFGTGKMFDKIAFAYDLGNRWMSLGLDQFWRQTLIKECLQLRPEDKVLDLATGTADVALLVGSRLKELAASELRDGGKAGVAPAVVGVDPSAEMLKRGVQKVRDVGLEGIIHLHQGDAQNLTSVDSVMGEPAVLGALESIASDSIDKISMSFGIRNVPDRDKALSEMLRVLRKSAGSRVCILEFSLPDGSSTLSKVAQLFIQQVIPMIGKVATLGKGGAEYQYLERSIVEFPAPQEFAAQMTRNGLPVHNITAFAYGSVQLYTGLVST